MKQKSDHIKPNFAEAQERREILRRYRRLIEVWHTRKETQDRWEVRKAFKVAAEAHKDMRRKSGEPFILHPLEVATIAAGDLGLGRTSIIAALLHDTVEDTDLTLEDVEGMFGDKVARIIDGLTKIEGISETAYSTNQSETLKKVVYTMSDDVRVILVKLADRLHNMRTLDAMPQLKKLKIASETRYIYAPLANSLGLYDIKSELEELSFKYSNPDFYKQISHQIKQYSPKLEQKFNSFKKPLEEYYASSPGKVEIQLRNKTAFSIWKNMSDNELTFKDVFLIPTVKLIVNTKPEQEKVACWTAYADVTTLFHSNNSKLLDLVSQPKTNGYSAIHTVVMLPGGDWVNVQILSRRMDEIATRGYPAFWKYRDKNDQEGLEKWLIRTRELLKEANDEAIPFIDVFRKNLVTEEIIVFTPTGDLIPLPKGATVLDFAYTIHTDLGNKCIGANVNRKLKPIEFELRAGDQVEIISSKIDKVTEKWLDIVVSARAKARIKQVVKNKRRKFRKEGEEKFNKICKQLKAEHPQCNVEQLIEKLNLSDKTNFFYLLATNKLGAKEIKEVLFGVEQKSGWFHFPSILTNNMLFGKKSDSIEKATSKENLYIEEGSESDAIEFIIPSCCNPIPGDDVVSISWPNKLMEIHRTNCDVAIKYMSQYGKKITNPNWGKDIGVNFLSGVKLVSENKKGLVKMISTVLSDEYNLNIRKFDLVTIGEMIEVQIFLYVKGLDELKNVMKSLHKIKEVIKVKRIE
ncbi:MAG: RelA/SpoT family protein [Bacteroidetes bacterium]|nr:MAG: RelA/SpoT family protein [Bacteroidota bacterium]